MITAQTSPLYSEQKVSAVLGLSRADARHARDAALTPEEDWAQRAKAIVLTCGGLQKLLDHLEKTSRQSVDGLDFSGCLLAPQSEKKEGAADDLVPLTVVRLYPNVRLLLARDPAGEQVTVRVKDNTKFRPKMTLRGRLVGAGVYAHEGRCPRQPGRY